MFPQVEAVDSNPNVNLLWLILGAVAVYWFMSKSGDNIKPGDVVKASFTRRGETEHMWVIVNRVTKKGIVGTVDNDSVFNTQLKYGDRVTVPFDRLD